MKKLFIFAALVLGLVCSCTESKAEDSGINQCLEGLYSGGYGNRTLTEWCENHFDLPDPQVYKCYEFSQNGFPLGNYGGEIPADLEERACTILWLKYSTDTIGDNVGRYDREYRDLPEGFVPLPAWVAIPLGN